MTRILCVFGTRPEAIKMAPLIRELRRRGGLHVAVCSTSQHREMLDQVLPLFGVQVDHDLHVMRPGQSPTAVAAEVLLGMEGVLRLEKPDWVLVQGDTTTAAAAALAGFYAGARVGHVEAGLRTFDRGHPFPEEVNRRLVSVTAHRHFAPTPGARENLLREAIPDAEIAVTGNTVVDALQWTAALPPGHSTMELLARVVGTGRRMVLVTAHRRESFGAPIRQICQAVRALARAHAGTVQFVYPVHPNPAVREPVLELLDGVEGVTLTEPLDYPTLVHLLKHAYFVATDSGGIQEEAPALGVPALVLRETTERPEAVEAGTARVVGTSEARITDEAERLLRDPEARRRMAQAVNPFGDGRASERIAAALLGEPFEPFAPDLTRGR